jgi:RimJ/RimL family protein N-acetyltransferase
MKVEAVTLKGDYVRLELLGAQHAEGLLEAAADPLIWKYLTVPQPKTVYEMTSWIETALAQRDHLPFATVRLEDSRIVGSTRYLEIKPFDKTLEIGWTWLSTKAQRTPVNTEAKFLMLRHAFDELGAERVQLKTDAKNERSRKAIERIGAQFEGVLRSYQRYWHGAMRDTAMYSITAADWPAVRGELERKLERAPASKV